MAPKGLEPAQFATVIVEAPLRPLDYRIPPALAENLETGHAVIVPVGVKKRVGFVLRIHETPPDKRIRMRSLEEIDHTRPKVPKDVLDLIVFCADYYGATAGDVLSSALPTALKSEATVFVLNAAGHRALAAPEQAGLAIDADKMRLLAALAPHPKGARVGPLAQSAKVTRKKAQGLIRNLLARGLVDKKERAKASRGRTRTTFTRHKNADRESIGPRASRARLIFDLLVPDVPTTLAELSNRVPNPREAMATLVALNLVHREEATGTGPAAQFAQDQELGPTHQPAIPTVEQKSALDTLLARLRDHNFAPFLLHGVTGSGKTEVYLQLIAAARAAGGGALVLVPEIALTPQLGARFRARFGDAVATFHSGLTLAERRNEWSRVVSGAAPIGLGARSALFLPIENLKVLIVDEEHEASFKQDESPRYNARDLAIWRGQRARAVVVLGSATPSLETYANAQNKRYTYLPMPSRVRARPLPEVKAIALQKAERAAGGLLTLQLAHALEATWKRGEQAILFLNRRGFAPYVFCRDCGHTYRCPDCDVSLTLHLRRNIILCHYCGLAAPAPTRCEACREEHLGQSGQGTEAVEAEIRALFGDLPLVRLDRDTAGTRKALETLLTRFRRQDARLLIGTQMVAKGHDFPNVTLVGVVQGDASLNVPDFRASERTFQLLTQVSGRAGRGDKPGAVLVQAYETDHLALRTARHHAYKEFAEEELKHRRELGYPPFTFLALVRFTGENESETLKVAQADSDALGAAAQTYGLNVTLLGPAPAPVARIRGMWRVHLLLKATNRNILRQLLTRLPAARGRTVLRSVDIDPVNMV